MSLHGEIMNIPVDEDKIPDPQVYVPRMCYKIGHRDARHAAAELSIAYEKRIRELEEYVTHLEECI